MSCLCSVLRKAFKFVKLWISWNENHNFQRCIGPRRHSPTEGRLSLQAINLAPLRRVRAWGDGPWGSRSAGLNGRDMNTGIHVRWPRLTATKANWSVSQSSEAQTGFWANCLLCAPSNRRVWYEAFFNHPIGSGRCLVLLLVSYALFVLCQGKGEVILCCSKLIFGISWKTILVWWNIVIFLSWNH